MYTHYMLFPDVVCTQLKKPRDHETRNGMNFLMHQETNVFTPPSSYFATDLLGKAEHKPEEKTGQSQVKLEILLAE
jgi:hypothetical protein